MEYLLTHIPLKSSGPKLYIRKQIRQFAQKSELRKAKNQHWRFLTILNEKMAPEQLQNSNCHNFWSAQPISIPWKVRCSLLSWDCNEIILRKRHTSAHEIINRLFGTKTANRKKITKIFNNFIEWKNLCQIPNVFLFITINVTKLRCWFAPISILEKLGAWAFLEAGNTSTQHRSLFQIWVLVGKYEHGYF